jgi:hypothetical protein
MSQDEIFGDFVTERDSREIMNAQHKNPERRDWRVAAIIIIVLYGSLLIGAAGFIGIPAKSLLWSMGVPALDHPLMDLRGVAVWCEMFRHGGSPMLHQGVIDFPGEQQYQTYLMNYSPVVLGMGWLGLLPMHVLAWGITLAVLYGFSLWFLAGSCSVKMALIWTLLICSPCSALVIERGNLDMLLFALLVTALLVRNHPLGASVAILVAGLIKFFPIGARVAVWREGGKKNRVAVILAGAIFLIFLFFLRSRLGLIGTSLTGQYQSAFGCGVGADLLRHYGIIGDMNYGFIRGGLVAVVCLLLAISGIFGLLTSNTSALRTLSDRTQYAFFLTAPFMLGLFVMGNQMDYKWIFFLPMVPAVLELLGSPDAVESGVSKIWFGGILAYSYWTFFSDEGSLRNALLKQAVMWVVMGMTAFLSGRLWKKEVKR